MVVMLAPLFLAPISVASGVKLDQRTPKEVVELFEVAIRATLGAKLAERNWTLSTVDEGSTLSISIRKVKWRNRSREEIFARPGGPGSETEVELDLRFSTPGGTVELKAQKGKAAGPFFGTTNLGELRGAPDDKARMVQVVHRQKVEAAARATWEVVKGVVPTLSASAGRG